MPKRKKGNRALWSVPRITDPRYPGLTVRVTELSAGGTLYAVHRSGGRQRMASLKRTRRDLGNTVKKQRAKARAIALDLIEKLATTSKDSDGDESVETPEVLTLGTLVTLYEREGLHGVGVPYARDQVRKVRRFIFFALA